MKTFLIKLIEEGEPYIVHQQRPVQGSGGQVTMLDIGLNGRLIGVRVQTKTASIQEIPPSMFEVLEFSQDNIFPPYEELIQALRQQNSQQKFPPGFPPGFPFFPGNAD